MRTTHLLTRLAKVFEIYRGEKSSLRAISRIIGSVLLVALATPAAQAAVMDFEVPDLRPTAQDAFPAPTYSENGLTLTNLTNQGQNPSLVNFGLPGIASNGTQSFIFWYNSSATASDVVLLTATSGSSFSLLQLDAANPYGCFFCTGGPPPQDELLNFVSIRAGGGTINEQFDLNGGWTTISLGFTDVVSVAIFGSDPIYPANATPGTQLDNIVADLPEPSTLSLLAAALGAVWLVRRRKPAVRSVRKMAFKNRQVARRPIDRITG